ncbi:MAG TPA: ABC transporter substrate-binding protein [Acidimicrobiales bacterium]|nr:ABC transporter substrate-binding protein [Acidimicrobiales bacterium]
MRVRRALAFLAAIAVVATACGDDGGDGEASPTTTPGATTTAGGPTTTKAPVSGGTLVFGNFSEPASLDNVVSTGSGTTGGTEMAAVFDTLMRYNPDTGEYEGRTAETVTPSADFLEWTIKLRAGIKFSDGSPYDAEAVAFGLNRHRVGTSIPASECATYYVCPRNSTSSGVYMALVKDIQVVDATTLKVTLNEPWSAFPYALSDEASQIPSNTELKRVCTATAPIRECTAFSLKPVGAGPFMVQSFVPKEAITMVKNPNYWGGQVYLDGFKSISINDQGGAQTYDGLKTGTFNVVYLRTPATVFDAKEAKHPGFSETSHGGGLILLNTGVTVTCTGGQPASWCEGKPDGPTKSTPATENLKVRQAIQAAIDPNVIDQRANDGKGHPGSALLQDDFRWNPGVPAPKYDPERAKQLVAEAKAEGWDGEVRMLYSNGKFAVDVALTTQALLEAVGIKTVVDTSKDTTAQVVQVISQRDFELTGWGTTITNDDGAAAALAQNLASTSTSNRVGYSNPAVDQALKDLRKAKDDTEKKAAYKIILENVYRDVPIYAWAKIEARIIWSDKVNGITPNHSGVFFLHDAWMEQ